MADEKREFQTSDFVLCKWDVDTDDGGKRELAVDLCASVSVVRAIHGG